MNRICTFSIICLTYLLVGCGPSDEKLLRNAETTVQSFIDELNMENFNSAREVYPDMSKISRYKIPQNFNVSSAKFTSDKKNEIKIIGNYGTAENTKSMQFVLSKNEANTWEIIKSKGLSSYYESSLYNILKISGCLADIESDASIHQTCKDLEPKFESLVNKYKTDIENLITFEKNGSNLSNNYNISISGELMLKNNSNLAIPGFSYEIYIVSYDRNNNPSHSSKYQFNSDQILANDYHQITIYSMDYHRDYKTYSAVIKITNDQFIRSYLARQGNLNCSELYSY
jgi:hypothetical protein